MLWLTIGRAGSSDATIAHVKTGHGDASGAARASR
jgi:hypothetical protein